MKKISLFGNIAKISSILSFVFIVCAMIDMTLHGGFDWKDVLLTLAVFAFVIVSIYWICSVGLVFDYNNNRIKLILGITKKNRHERVLSEVCSVSVEIIKNYGAYLVFDYNNGTKEKILYRFYRQSWLEEIQFTSFKKKIDKANL